MNQNIEPSIRLPDVREQITYEGESARSSIVDAYFQLYSDLFGVTPYAKLDVIAPGSIKRGDYWAWKKMPGVEWSDEDPTQTVIEQCRRLLVVETERDVADFERHAHLTGVPGIFREHDLAEVDMVVAGTDRLGRADRIRRKYGLPVFVIEQMDGGPSLIEFERSEEWMP